MLIESRQTHPRELLIKYSSIKTKFSGSGLKSNKNWMDKA